MDNTNDNINTEEENILSQVPFLTVEEQVKAAKKREENRIH